jgi:hypothetical protein
MYKICKIIYIVFWKPENALKNIYHLFFIDVMQTTLDFYACISVFTFFLSNLSSLHTKIVIKKLDNHWKVVINMTYFKIMLASCPRS